MICTCGSEMKTSEQRDVIIYLCDECGKKKYPSTIHKKLVAEREINSVLRERLKKQSKEIERLSNITSSM